MQTACGHRLTTCHSAAEVMGHLQGLGEAEASPFKPCMGATSAEVGSILP